MRAAPFPMRFTARSDEPATQEHVLTPPDGAHAAEVHGVSTPLGMRTWRPVGPARSTRPALLGPA
ncbi:hypothetical protein [Streptomyces flavofungini]|uniref:Uncharacterized protein n=1 Tax=Streptomyces flavofungini TaxID=68200 RepID=A0ABS0X4V9_9ACTN|nr:hypothetical protein [Streptomyces flavofungini]MBJ3808051.1 hypothetical protein [Streptomyces flavofungini]GHC83163.1 hypothetical protein GCM10010349_67410 [Streptomyces flavofungini]